MKGWIGFLMILAGIALGFYVGLWLCFIGGIIQIINEIKSPASLDAMNIAIGVVKIMMAGLAGWASALACIVPGVALIKKSLNTKSQAC